METAIDRLRLILGDEALSKLRDSRVMVIGLGGVGSSAAEALARGGIGSLVLIDRDIVMPSNINRQALAFHSTLGRPKTEVMEQMVLDINPDCKVSKLHAFLDKDHVAEQLSSLPRPDYVIDAIDSLESKAYLIRHALSVPTVTLFASMGAALKMDPFQIRQSVFTKVEGDGLARALRQKFRQTGGIPERPFVCVWSPEQRKNRGVKDSRGNGTVAHTTAIFGFALAGLVVTDVERRVTAGCDSMRPAAT